MTRSNWPAIFVLALGISMPHAALGQNVPAATQDTTAAQPQSDAPQESQPSTASTTPTKKVWTNDDVGDLRGRSAISTVGVAANTKQPKQQSTKVASPATINSYRNQILKLQAQLPDMDSKIADLQGVLSGNTVNSVRHATGAKIDDWHDELAKLQEQRAATVSKISELQDQARHSGVPENQIPE